MELKGIVERILTPQSGVSKAGKSWSKVGVVFHIDGTYPKKALVTFMGKSFDDAMSLKVGDECRVAFSVESREFNEKWYTDISGFQIEVTKMSEKVQQPAAQNKVAPKQETQNTFVPPSDDLPF